jgi:hypothetical protein
MHQVSGIFQARAWSESILQYFAGRWEFMIQITAFKLVMRATPYSVPRPRIPKVLRYGHVRYGPPPPEDHTGKSICYRIPLRIPS